MNTPLNKTIHIKNATKQLEKLGFSQSSIAEKLGVTRECVSQWMQGKKFPRPAMLLKLSNLLQLPFNELILKTAAEDEPVVAFRKKGNHRITPQYFEEAKDKGFLLEQLISYLPYDYLSAPPALIAPELKYEYIQAAAARTRKAIKKESHDKIDFQDLIDFFNQHHAVIIPVFWGNKNNHENALHIYLPKSRTTWIYLNLDSKIHDFKFWMAHELGHVKAPGLKNEEAEDFADFFAGALLVSQELAKQEYSLLKGISSQHLQLARIKEIAEELTIAPLTVYYEINRYAEYTKQPKVDLETDDAIFKVNRVFCNQYKSIAGHLFDSLPPSPADYIESARKYFGSPFFEAIQNLLKNKTKSVSFLQAILNLSPPDAHALYESLFA